MGRGRGPAAPGHAGHRVRLRSEQREQTGLQRALVQFDGEAEAEPADHVEQLLQGDPFGVEQDLLAGVEDPQVGEHLALRREQRRVAAATGQERLHIVGDLTLQERLGVRADERELAALGTIDEPAGLGRGTVFGVGDGERGHIGGD